MKVALAQINTTVGDIAGNAALVLGRIAEAERQSADLVVFPELCLFGYPPKDLVLRRELVARNVSALETIARRCTKITAIVGFVQPDPERAGKGIYNAAAVCHGGKVAATYAKMLLPTYDVFDESRYFNAGSKVQTFMLPTRGGSLRLGLTICEDLWNDQQFEGRRVYGIDPIESVVRAGAEMLINLSASPYRADKQAYRERLFADQAREHGVPLVYVNLVGGNDDLVFDGASMVFDAAGCVIARAQAFVEDFKVIELSAGAQPPAPPYPERIESIRRALVLGMRDYIHKCGFDKVVLGLSGGVDSAVTAALAVEAVGADRVCGVALPSRFSSGHSLEDAKILAKNLDISFTLIPIEHVHRALEEAVRPCFGNLPPDAAEENIQARIRGNILMALSNKFGWLLLTTGNKSELAVGYCTLYGDMCGGLAVLSDVPKTVVYRLAHHLNATWGRPCIPPRTLEKPPSAELRDNQTDQDALPPYDTLDAILECYVEQDLTVDAITARGFERATVERVVRMVDRSEYKRKQAAVGLKVTSRAFGTGRRMPIAAKSV